MNGPYFQKKQWSRFVYQDQCYGFDHLNEYVFCVKDSGANLRKIVVTFEDHCFTRNWKDGDEEALIYPACSRPKGCFCIDRYQHSLELRKHIQWATSGQVWNIEDRNLAILPTITHHGRKLLYSIVFSLDRVTGLPVDLRMRVRSAHQCDEKTPATFGNIRFPHLVTLRMQSKPLPKNFDHRRKRPQVQ
jgi:hypothetical protein